jgi:lysophospholipase L1-like esterase
VPELRGAKTVEHWYFIAGVDVAAPPEARAVVVLGDSITDGRGATTNGNDRWTDTLAQRLQTSPTTRNIAVLNQGIGGNHLLTDGLGQNALARFEDDVVGQPGVRYLIVLEGINDIGSLARKGEVASDEHEALVRRIVGAYEQMIARAHTHDIKVIGATIMPFAGSSYYRPGPASEGDRQAVNEWIRTPGHFDEVIDFDKIVRDHEHPERLLPAFDCGDHLHPSPAGYAAMAQGVPLSMLAPTAEPGPKIAITFDDLPAHGSLPPGETRIELISKIIGALREAHLPPTYGFVNGARLEQQPTEAAVLQAWLAAGNPLANHSWSHMNLNQHSLEDFEQDVVRNEPVLMQTLYQRDIPYVLLLHVGAFDAEMLRRLLQLYRARGFQFVTLPEAERDDFCSSVTDLDFAASPETLEEATSARQLSLPPRTDFALQLDSLCR